MRGSFSRTRSPDLLLSARRVRRRGPGRKTGERAQRRKRKDRVIVEGEMGMLRRKKELRAKSTRGSRVR